jgi:hypothetical protein
MVRQAADHLDDLFKRPAASGQSIKRFEAGQHVQRVDGNRQLPRSGLVAGGLTLPI